MMIHHHHQFKNNKGANNGWWKHNPPQQEHEQQLNKTASLRAEIVEFFTNFTLHSYRWLVDPIITSWELFVWIIVHVISFASIVYILMNASENYAISPMVTTLYDTLFDIKDVPFPGIAICDNNRISRKFAMAYAEQLYARDKTTYSLEYHFEQIRHMGKLYDLDNSEGDFLPYQVFLDTYDSNTTTMGKEYYDISAVMKKLGPNCNDLVLRCYWNGEEVPCMDPSMISFRATQYGYCCTFNYIRPDSLKEKEPPSFFYGETGPDLGLVMLLKTNISDYYYPLFNFVGFIVQVFNPLEFPDVPSGSVSQAFVELGSEKFIRIDSSTLKAEDETRLYSSKTRGCLFPDELERDFAGRYKRSDCVVRCRIASIVALCNCVLFYLPDVTINGRQNNMRKCTMADLPCLSRYDFKWSTTVLEMEKQLGLEKEQADGLVCPECLPSCSDTFYTISSMDLPLVETKRNYDNILSGVENVSDVTILRIFLGQTDTWLYKQIVTVKWYEIISNLGGICGVIAGFSIICVAELIYFILKNIFKVIQANLKTESSTKHETGGMDDDSTFKFQILP